MTSFCELSLGIEVKKLSPLLGKNFHRNHTVYVSIRSDGVQQKFLDLLNPFASG